MVLQNHPVPSVLPSIIIFFPAFLQASGVLASENILRREVTEEKGNTANAIEEKSLCLGMMNWMSHIRLI